MKIYAANLGFAVTSCHATYMFWTTAKKYAWKVSHRFFVSFLCFLLSLIVFNSFCTVMGRLDVDASTVLRWGYR